MGKFPHFYGFWPKKWRRSPKFVKFPKDVLNIGHFTLFGLEKNFLGGSSIILKIHRSIAHPYVYVSFQITVYINVLDYEMYKFVQGGPEKNQAKIEFHYNPKNKYSHSS